jgi:hypothetical protein
MEVGVDLSAYGDRMSYRLGIFTISARDGMAKTRPGSNAQCGRNTSYNEYGAK